MKNEGAWEPYAAKTSEAGARAASAPKEAALRFRNDGARDSRRTPGGMPYRTVGEARVGAREMLHNHRVLRIAIVEDRIPPQFVE